MISYKLFAEAPADGSGDLQVTVSVEDGDQTVRSLLSAIQRGAPTGQPYSAMWDGKNDSGQPVPINTSYRITISADRVSPTTQPPQLVNANPKETAVIIRGSQQVKSTDGKLSVIFRPDDAAMKIDSLVKTPRVMDSENCVR